MSVHKVDTEAAGLEHHAFADKVYTQDSSHPAHRYATSQFSDRKIVRVSHGSIHRFQIPSRLAR